MLNTRKFSLEVASAPTILAQRSRQPTNQLAVTYLEFRI